MQSLKRAGSAVSSLLRASSKCRTSQNRFMNEEARDRVRALKVGDKLHGYTVERVEEVPEIFITAAMLSHDKTGAQHLHAARDDQNNTFSVTFRTTPMDSSGVPHILEHTVLCGSEKYPVRDPFFKMLSRSTATFMNAMTAADWTMYPFSSLNEQDFKNLMSVYMDAAFFPLIRELDFCQEGWRLEHSDPKDPTSPIVFKGVVYNEMKGVFSNSQSTFAQEALNAMLPSHTYGVVSGGDPAHIPKLTYEQLKQFHASHYHPSNAKFFTYGNLPVEGHLEFINSYLEKFDKITPDTAVPNEPRWDKPKSKTITCVPDPMAADPEKQTTVSISFLMSDITDMYEAFIVNVMCHLMVQGETAPFYRALLESNIGSDYSPNTGYLDYTRDAIFSVGLANITSESVGLVAKMVEETIDKVIVDGFETTRINALLHQIELSQKHQTSNFGFHLAVGLASLWNHDGDPVLALQTSKYVDQFRKDLKANPKLLQEKVKQYLKDNTHRLFLTMEPDPKLEEAKKTEEKQRLDKLVAALSESDKQKIVTRGTELQEKQNEKEDISCLPSLRVEDLDKKIKPEPMELSQADWSFIQCCEQPTNGVTYLRMASNLEEVPEELMAYVPLFCEVITSMGVDGHDFLWLSQQEELYTGGLNATPLLIPHHTKNGHVQRAILLSSHCLEQNFRKMLELWTLIINSPDFSDMNRLTTLIKMSASNLSASLSGQGHSYARHAASSTLSAVSNLEEKFFGYSQVRLMKQVAELTDLGEVVNNLHNIASVVLDKSCLRLSVNTTPTSMEKTVLNLKSFLANLKGEATMCTVFPEMDQITPESHQTQYELPFSVNYVAQSFPAVRYAHKDYVPLQVLATLMSRKFLHREIREKGGAYGSGAQVGSAVFNFYSYRDPHSLETLETFNRCIEWASKGDFSEEDIEEAKLGVFQQIDKPVPPGNRGQMRFIYDISDDLRQKNRDRLFAVNGDDLMRVTKTYLQSEGPTGKAFLGPANEDVRNDETWTVVSEENGESSQPPSS